MEKIFLKSLIIIGISLSALYGIDKREYLVEHGFIEKDQENPSKSISCEFKTLPTPTGPFQIGVKIFDLADENRENRLIPIWIFFPEEKGDHIPYPKLSERRALDTFEIIDIWEKLKVNVHAKLVDNLDFLKNRGIHPVIFFNNGNGMLCSDSIFLLEDLASHGYIVVSIQNQLNTDKLEAARFTKGTVENYNKVIRNNHYVFDWLKNNNKTIFYDSLDLSKIGVVGYSMGANSLLLWADRVSRDSTKNHFLFQHEGTDVKECIVSLDARRIAFPLIHNTPIFMLISAENQEEQKKNGEFELMQKTGHKFKYYKDTHHGSFTDHAYLNIECPSAPKMGWFYGSTEERMQFFDEMRKDIREFLDRSLKNENSLEMQDITLQMNVDKLIKLAEKESLVARLMLIHMFTEGIGVEKNINEAEKWMLMLSSQMDQTDSQNKIQKFKDESDFLEKKILNNRCESNELAIFKAILGYMFLRGWGVEKNYDLAFRYLKESADLGNALSNVDLGEMYQKGLGTERDFFEAFHRYRFAASKGVAVAFYRLGLMYEKGIGVEKNSKKAEEFFQQVDLKIRKHLDKKNWKIGGKIHFEEQSAFDYLGTVDLNRAAREAIKKYFSIKSDLCALNAKVLIKKENGDFIIRHYEEKAFPGIGEELHATLLYTSKRINEGHETLQDIYDNLIEVNKNLPTYKAPSIEEIAQTYQLIIKPDWKFKISDVEFIVGKTGSVIIAKLQYEGREEIMNESGKPVSGNFLHLTLANIDSSMESEVEKINLVVNELKAELIGNAIKIGNRNGLADLEFGVSGSKERIRPSLIQGKS
jgi:hypothetical protein